MNRPVPSALSTLMAAFLMGSGTLPLNAEPGTPVETKTAAETETEIRFDVVSTAKERITLDDDYTSPLWLSSTFDGSHWRGFANGELVVRVAHTKGGFDTGVARSGSPPMLVDELHADAYVDGTFEASSVAEGEAAVGAAGPGHWCFGPKISVNWNRDAGQETDGWYENYIVDTATKSPAELEAWLFKAHKAEAIGETRHDGTVYKHYWLRHKDWVQYWAVRQDYRDGGVTHLKPIVELWRSHGLPNKRFDGVKLNVETFGPNACTFVFRDVYIPKLLAEAPDRVAPGGDEKSSMP